MAVAPGTALRGQVPSGCRPPIAARSWGALVAGREQADGSRAYSAPPAPRVARHAREVQRWAGTYRLTMVRTEPAGAQAAEDTVAAGRLQLRAVRRPHGPRPRAEPVVVLIGASDLPLPQLGHVSLAHSAASRAPDRPGVEVTFTEASGEVALTLGNASGADGPAEDAGVVLTVFRSGATGFGGWWRDGGAVSPTTEGYFCAVRVEEHRRGAI